MREDEVGSNPTECRLSVRPYRAESVLFASHPGLRCASPWAILSDSLREQLCGPIHSDAAEGAKIRRMKQELQKNFKFSVLFAVAMGFVLLCSAANGQADTHSVVGATMNLAGFDVLGLRLHMSPEEVISVMRDLSAKVSGDSYGCLRDKVSRLGKGRPPENVPFLAESVSFFENCPSLLIGHTPNGIEIRVDFTEDLAKTPGAVKAWHIRTVQSIGFTSTDRAVFFDAVKEKYGRPPYAKLTSGNESLGYCDKLGPNEACEFNDYRLQSGLSRINDSPISDYSTLMKPGGKIEVLPSRMGMYVHLNPEGASSYNGIVDLWDCDLRRTSRKVEDQKLNETRTLSKPEL